jgi:hypothetical protein
VDAASSSADKLIIKQLIVNDLEGRRRVLCGGTEESHNVSATNSPSLVRHVNAECPLLSRQPHCVCSNDTVSSYRRFE